MPFDRESASPDRPVSFGPVAVEDFLFIGRGLTADEFTAYVRDFDFGPIPPDFIVLHHTGNPGLRLAPSPDPNHGVWDAGEENLSAETIFQRRLTRLTNMREFYRRDLGWDRGPHLYIDDRFIWLFTPMSELGIHARWGNSFRGAAGALHYSIGIEVIGHYETRQWPEPVARLVGHAVAALKQRLGTFELEYLYPNGNPGRIGSGDDERCAHPERLRAGGISSHRDYNKPTCPGAAITEAFYLSVLRAGWETFRSGRAHGEDDSTILERAYQADQQRLGAKRFAGQLRRPDLVDGAAESYQVLVCERGILAAVNQQAREITGRCLDEVVRS